jgi:hypothetical protein
MIKKKVDRDLNRLDERSESLGLEGRDGVYETFRHGESLGKLVAKWFISFPFF